MAATITLFARLLVTSSPCQLPIYPISPYHPIIFCLLFSKNFNIVSAFLSANRQPDRKKTILAKVGIDATRVSMSVLAK